MSTIGSHRTHQSKMMPETVAGKWSVVSFGVLYLGAMGLFAAAASGETGGETILDNLWLGIPALVGLVGAINSMISGLIAVIGRREQGASVFIATAASTLIVLFVALTLIFG
jgi:hypothetical protein